MRKSDFRIVLSVLMGIAVIIFLIYGSTTLGLDVSIRGDLVDVLPGLVIFFIGAGLLVKIGASEFAIAGFGILGAGLALLLGQMNDTGLLVPDLLTAALTIEELQGFIIVMSLLIGGVVSAVAWRD